MKFALFISIFFWGTLSVRADTHNHKAHVHGAAKLTLAMENDTSASVDLDVSGDSIMGFEHEAKSAQDKKLKDDGFKKLREQATQVIRFDPKTKCAVKVIKVEIEKEENGAASDNAHHGEHSDVNASYTITCAAPLSGSKVQIGLISLFPKIKTVSFQILTSSKQVAIEVKDEHSFVQIP